MNPILIAPPTLEPVSLAQAKLYLRIDAADEDDLVLSLIKAARALVEAASGRMLIHQGWRIVRDAWPEGGAMRLPLSPVSQILGARIRDAAGLAIEIPASLLALTPADDPPLLRLTGPAPTPGQARAGIEIDVLAGHGATASDVPEPFRRAILVLVAHWFERRGDEGAAGDGAARLPAEVMALIAPSAARGSDMATRNRSPIGAARCRLVLEQPVTLPDGAGGVQTQFVAVGAIWARLRWTGGEERLRAGRPEQAARHEITIRWRPGVDAGMRFTGLGRAFAIRSAGDPEGDRRRLVCLCEEITP